MTSDGKNTIKKTVITRDGVEETITEITDEKGRVTVDGIDVQAVKKRAADLAADAHAFVEQVKDRGDQFREEAVTIRDAGTDNMRRVASTDLPKGPAGAVDFDEIVQGAAKNASARGGEAPQFIAFASLSMPDAALKQMVRDTASAGGVVVDVHAELSFLMRIDLPR